MNWALGYLKLNIRNFFTIWRKEGMYNDFYNSWSDDKRWNYNAQTYTAIFTFK
jgi:hypothetical protein